MDCQECFACHTDRDEAWDEWDKELEWYDRRADKLVYDKATLLWMKQNGYSFI
jgi:hypothetical protein